MTEHGESNSNRRSGTANNWLAFRLLTIVVVMVGLSFAAVPLYRLFCQVTGYAGTTQRAEAPSAAISEREISIRFDANTDTDLGWSFQPVQNRIDVKIGDNRLAFYKAVNTTGRAVTGTATFNVTPEIAGAYFNKVDCFCFTEQTLAAGQEADMPVSFFVDPAILDDPEARAIEEITLSYTFFKVETDAEAASAEKDDDAATRTFEKGQRSG